MICSSFGVPLAVGAPATIPIRKPHISGTPARMRPAQVLGGGDSAASTSRLKTSMMEAPPEPT